MSPNNSFNNIIEEDEIGSKTPLLINESDGGDEIKKEEEVVKIPLRKHKYIGQLVLLYTLFTLYITGSYLYAVYLPNVFLQHAKNQYPNYTAAEVQSKASYYKSYSDSLPYIPLFLFGPLAGYLSDKYGRKPILYFTVIITLLDVGSCLLTIKTNNLMYYYAVHTISGINGVLLAAVFSCISDISDEQHVSPLYSLLAFFMGLGVVVGPSLVVFVPTSLITGPFLLYLTIGITVLCLLLIPFLKETLTIAQESNKIKETLNTINPFKSLKNVFKTSGYISWVILVYISLSFSSQDVWSTYYYYCGLMYGWDEKQNGEFVVFLGVLVMVFGGLIFPILLKYFSERKLISFSFLVSVVSHILLVFSGNKKWGMFVFLIATGLGTNNPNTNNLLSSLISKASPASSQGTILAGVTGITSIASFLGALASNDIYTFSTSVKFYFPQFIYLLNTVILGITFIGTLLIWKFYKNPNPLLKNIK